jgi:predicted RecB family nuclease
MLGSLFQPCPSGQQRDRHLEKHLRCSPDGRGIYYPAALLVRCVHLVGGTAMATTITREVLEAYLACRYKGHLRLAGERGDKSEYELLMAEKRERVCQAATQRLLAGHADCDVLRDVTVTSDLLKQGAALLLDAIVEGEGLSVRFDGLQRKAGPSRLGDYHYVPVLFHEGERPVREQRALLELLGLVLAEVQGREPGWGVLVHGQGCRARRLKLGAGVGRARRALQAIRDMQGTGTSPRLLLNAHCQVCEFRQRCHAEATSKDDLSLLRGISEKEVAKYARRGIFTVTQLSCTFRPRRKPKRSKQQGQLHQHALQALAVRSKKVYILGTPELPSSSVRIYLDIEGDPERRFDYLLGLIVEANGVAERYSFWADSPAEEPRLFQQFLDVVGRHEGFRLYTYGGYEAASLRRMAKDSGREDLVREILARSVNVLAVVRSHFYFPTHSNGLKDIGGYLGCRWTEENASGIQSIVWRRRWEETGSAPFKDRLTTYNAEDCTALREVTQFLGASCLARPASEGAGDAESGGHPVARVEQIDPQATRPDWGRTRFALPDFGFVNERAHFDYQRDKVFVRAGRTPRKAETPRSVKKWKKGRRVNREVELGSQACPSCGGTDLTRRPHGALARLALDLRITRSGIKRWVTRYRTAWHHCAGCGQRFLPADYLRLEEYGHSLKSWAMYEYVAHRTSLANIAETTRECFGLPIYTDQVHNLKHLLAQYYEATYERLLERIVAGHLIHADETEVHVRGVGKAYVWVFTNLEEVVFLYRPSREGDFLHDLLKDFRGVLVSDFYAAYDSLGCPQQKCLVHLVRDFNQDIRCNPWDEELKSLAGEFGSLLRGIVETIDRYGLRRRHLGKHRRAVDGFFDTVAGRAPCSEVAEGYCKRLLKYRDKLFTFLDHDGVPWNNNRAEHAVKQFAHYREYADGQVTEAGLKEYLVLLSVAVTCKYKGVSFLKFLLSRETDIDLFRQGGGKRAVPAVEVYPEGTESDRRSRKRLGVTHSGAKVDAARGGPGQAEAVPDAPRAE